MTIRNIHVSTSCKSQYDYVVLTCLLCHMVDDPVRTPIMLYVENQNIQSKEQGREKGYDLEKSFSLTRGHLRHRQHFITDTYWEHWSLHLLSHLSVMESSRTQTVVIILTFSQLPCVVSRFFWDCTRVFSYRTGLRQPGSGYLVPFWTLLLLGPFM